MPPMGKFYCLFSISRYLFIIMHMTLFPFYPIPMIVPPTPIRFPPPPSNLIYDMRSPFSDSEFTKISNGFLSMEVLNFKPIIVYINCDITYFQAHWNLYNTKALRCGRPMRRTGENLNSLAVGAPMALRLIPYMVVKVLGYTTGNTTNLNLNSVVSTNYPSILRL